MDIIKQYHQIIQSDNLKDTAFDLLLKQKKIKINWSNDDGVTLLMQVAEHKYLHGFDACIKAGADPNAYTPLGYSVLSHVLMDCVLIEPDDCDKIKRDMLTILQKNDKFKISFPTEYRVLCLKQVKEHDDLLGEFFVRVKYDDYDPNKIDEEDGLNALHWAAKKGYPDPVFKEILAKITDVNAAAYDGMTALMEAVENNHLDIVKELMKHEDINMNLRDKYEDSTALHLAASYATPAIVTQLLSSDKVGLYEEDTHKRTALKRAVIKHRTDIVQAFVDSTKWDAYEYDEYENSVLHIAIEKKYNDITRILLDSGMEIEYTRSADEDFREQYTALILAAEVDNFDAVKMLVEKGADVDFQTSEDGLTALIIAVIETNNLDMIKYLVEHGADVDKMDLGDETALDHAKKGSKIYNYLKSKSTTESAESDGGSDTEGFQEKLKF